MKRKRCVNLIDAFLGLQNSGGNRAPYLLIVGDGEERAYLEARVNSSNTDSIRCCGFRNQTELARYFELCDVFVLPSVQEPFGLIVNEVMSAGRPVVVSDEVGCQPDLVTDTITGRVYPARDVSALRRVLESLITDPTECIEIGKRGKERMSTWSCEEDIIGLRQALRFLVSSCHDREGAGRGPSVAER